MAIEYNQLYEALEARVNQLALVDDLSRTVTASLDQHTALNAIGTQVPRAVPCQRLSLDSYDSTKHTFTIRALWLASDQPALRFEPAEHIMSMICAKAFTQSARSWLKKDCARSCMYRSWPQRDAWEC